MIRRPRLLAALVALVVLAANIDEAAGRLGGSCGPGCWGPPNPTHRWDFSANANPQRGNSTATLASGLSTDVISNSTLLFAQVGDNVPAISTVLSASGSQYVLPTATKTAGIRITEAVTYQLRNAHAVDASPWADVGTPILGVDVGPDPWGGTTGDSVQDDDAGVVEGRSQAQAITNDSTRWQASTWARCGTSHLVDFTLALTGGTPVTTTTTFTCNSTIKKVTAEATNNSSGNVTATVTVRGTQDVASQTGTATYAFTQLYNEAFISLAEPSVGASADVTYDATLLSYATVDHIDTGTICEWVNTSGHDTSSVPLWEWTAGGLSFGMLINSSDQVEVVADTAGADLLAVSSLTITRRAWTHVCVIYDRANGIADIYINGTLDSSPTNPAEVWDSTAFGTTFRIGQNKAAVRGDTIHAGLYYYAGRQYRSGPRRLYASGYARYN